MVLGPFWFAGPHLVREKTVQWGCLIAKRFFSFLVDDEVNLNTVLKVGTDAVWVAAKTFTVADPTLNVAHSFDSPGNY